MKALAARFSVFWLVWALVACATETPKGMDTRDRFVGEWKSADTNAQTHTRIKRSGDNFFIHEGLNDLVGTYDASLSSVMIDNGTKKVAVKYLPNTDQIMVTGGSREAKFSRVK